MDKKIILITGSSDGIGKITATALAKQGHCVIIHGRNEAKVRGVVEAIKLASGNDAIDYVVADLLSLQQVKAMAMELTSRYGYLDVLINNAGAIFGKERKLSVDGFEQTIALNLLAPFLLIKLLLPSLQKSRSGRIINLYSAMHRRAGRPDLSDFNLERNFRTDRAYGLSKLYLVWLTRSFHQLFQKEGLSNLTINACHPGAVASNFGQDADKGFLMNSIFKMALYFMAKPEQGAGTSIYLASSPEVEGLSGNFYDAKAKLEKPDDRYYSEENAKIVWDFCDRSTKAFL
ncbi:SDR family NAD(P)-dependent oxidoreductase [Sphingobacterium humi]|uniref:SDR family NAD(P)-dependent oxidoreductase n=1 Tax=Sphingobacterium humi TaxID=1796905 RepID=A0A6N8KT02_9SPHI|nr:SDR family NAD(P)-dependent oxidoreductase [Sphingobacterium humi]MVZ60545.1 SDR family NAD(P)-dependent oxidoreductase [Sphingobacterium humi]